MRAIPWFWFLCSVLVAACWTFNTCLGVGLAFLCLTVGSGFLHELFRWVMPGRCRREMPMIGCRTIEQLTQVEREVCEKIVGTYRCRDLLPEMRDRAFPLICGPSGAGKTTAVRAAVTEISRLHYRAHPTGAVTYLELHPTSWIPAGAAQPTTLRVISDAIDALAKNKHGLLIIFLDELDKLRNTTRENGNSAWCIGNMQEIQALLGRSVGILPRRPVHALSRIWRRAAPHTVLRNAYFIGAGAFQDVYRTANGAFGLDALDLNKREDDLPFEAHSQKEPFNADDFQLYTRAQWIMLPPPSPDDLRRAALVMIAGPVKRRLEDYLDLFVERASSTQSPLRTLEALIMMKCLDLLNSGGNGYHLISTLESGSSGAAPCGSTCRRPMAGRLVRTRPLPSMLSTTLQAGREPAA